MLTIHSVVWKFSYFYVNWNRSWWVIFGYWRFQCYNNRNVLLHSCFSLWLVVFEYPYQFFGVPVCWNTILVLYHIGLFIIIPSHYLYFPFYLNFIFQSLIFFMDFSPRLSHQDWEIIPTATVLFVSFQSWRVRSLFRSYQLFCWENLFFGFISLFKSRPVCSPEQSRKSGYKQSALQESMFLDGRSDTFATMQTQKMIQFVHVCLGVTSMPRTFADWKGAQHAFSK